MKMIKVLSLIIFILIIDVYANKRTSYEDRLGKTVAATILGKYEQSKNEKLINYVNLVGQSIVETSGRKDIYYYFTVLKDDDTFAVACPGGYIFISTGLIKLLKNESELAGILAHEISHVNEKHVLDELDTEGGTGASMLTQILMARHTTTTVALSEMSDKAITMVLDKGLNEGDEFDSDIAAILFLQKTGYYPQSYLDALSRLPTDKLTHSKTHPDLDNRIKALKEIFPNDLLNSGVKLKERFDNHAIFN
ncbi:MAG: M48 family metalloprotease [Candidatus Margulisiibacteriota bacterium]|nr:M48 family metalloprotease [Candidatus Margulisiibacteriota bacterium]